MMKIRFFDQILRVDDNDEGDPEILDESDRVIKFDDEFEAADYLEKNGIIFYSSSGFSKHGWYLAEPYHHPYRGHEENFTAHVVTKDSAEKLYDLMRERGFAEVL